MTGARKPRSFLFVLDVLEAGGVQRDVLKIGRALLARGDRCTVAAFRSERDALSQLYREAGVDVVFLGKRRRLDFAFLRRLGRLARAGGFDFVHALSPQAAFWTACVLPRQNRPIFAGYLFNTHSFDRLPPRLIESFFTARRLDAVFANSRAGVRYYRRRVFRPPCRFHIPNGVDPAPEVSRVEARRELHIPDSEFAMATVGRLVEVKRQADAIGALARMSGTCAAGRLRPDGEEHGTANPDAPQCAARLYLIGDGPQRPALEQLARDRAIADRVVFLGERSDVRRLLPAFDLFALPSRSEGMPNALLEAMAAGLPCVATRVGGVGEAITDGANGLLVEPCNPDALARAMSKLTRDPARREALGRAARETIGRRFTSHRMTRLLLSRYDRLFRRLRPATSPDLIQTGPQRPDEAPPRADRPPASPAPSGPAIAFVFSQFPKLSEHFLLREVVELERRGKRACVVSLKPCRDRVIHSAAERLARERIAPAWFGPGVLWDNACWLVARPLRYVRALAEMTWMHRRHPSELVKCLAAWPKTASAAREAARRGARHVHAMWASVPAACGLAMSRLLDCAFSFSAHAFDIYGVRHPLAEKIQKAEFVITCAQRNVEHLRAMAGKGNGSRVSLVRHFSDPPVGFSTRPARTGSPVILCVGSLERYKGHDVLLRAAALLKKRGRDFEMRVVGGGSRMGELAALADSLGLSDRVRLAGPMPHRQVQSMYRDASVFALASIRVPGGGEDNLPNVLVEAALFGVPSVMSDLGGAREFIQDGETGLLVEPGDAKALAAALERLLDDEALRQRLGEAARARALELFDRESNITLFESLLDRALRSGPRREEKAAAMEVRNGETR